jgi:hypothetical protein
MTVHAALNTVKFRLRESNTGTFPRGIAFMFRETHDKNIGVRCSDRCNMRESTSSIEAAKGYGEMIDNAQREVREQVEEYCSRYSILAAIERCRP